MPIPPARLAWAARCYLTGSGHYPLVGLLVLELASRGLSSGFKSAARVRSQQRECLRISRICSRAIPSPASQNRSQLRTSRSGAVSRNVGTEVTTIPKTGDFASAHSTNRTQLGLCRGGTTQNYHRLFTTIVLCSAKRIQRSKVKRERDQRSLDNSRLGSCP